MRPYRTAAALMLAAAALMTGCSSEPGPQGAQSSISSVASASTDVSSKDSTKDSAGAASKSDPAKSDSALMVGLLQQTSQVLKDRGQQEAVADLKKVKVSGNRVTSGPGAGASLEVQVVHAKDISPDRREQIASAMKQAISEGILADSGLRVILVGQGWQTSVITR